MITAAGVTLVAWAAETAMVGRTVSHYRIIERLGSGGMGVVYAAEDTRLGRRVALKFLPEDLTRDRLALERFQREARAASALNHPHICTIHDIGELDGQPFIAMELLEGETLLERLRRGIGSALNSPGADSTAASAGMEAKGVPLRVAETVAIALQLADALEAAHAKGILHRDIKPANIFLTTRGAAKLLDFGVAKLTSEPHAAETDAPTTAGAWATGAGVTLGTVGYMSPEQVRGEAVDPRTDLFSLGVVVYEMATGLAPFRGPTAGAVLSDILTKAPTAPVRLNPEVPTDLERLVNKLLEKNRALRCQSAADLRADLERLKRAFSSPAASARGDQASIVVLPFENLSPDPDNAFFADGLTEEIIADLSKVRALRVISRTSAMMFKGIKKSAPAIAQELDVRHVLEGSVRRAGNNLRITAQLIDATTDAHLWAEKYAGTLDDVFDLQEQLSRRIVDALKVALTPDEDRRLGARAAADPRVYEAWLRGRHAFHEMTRDGFERGARLARQALAIIGEDALLHAALAYFGYAMYDFGFGHDDQTLAEAERSAARSLELNPQLAQAHLVAGLVRWKYGDSQGMVRCLRRSLDLEWNSDAAGFMAFALTCVGRTAEARPYAMEAVARDPMNYLMSLSVALTDLYDGQVNAALSRFRDSRQRLDPNGAIATWWLAQTVALAGLEDEAGTLFDQVAAMDASVFSDTSRLFALALRDDRQGVITWLESADSMRAIGLTDEVYPTVMATALARVGEYDRALEWLGHAVSWGMANHRFLSEHNRFLAPLRGDPRFEALLDRAREKERAFEV
jgi:serine/threonine protein kinase